MKHFILLVPVLASLLAGCVTGLDAENSRGQTATKNTEFMLSFDDGPLPGTTERVLDILATLKAIDGTPVKAGFFLLANAPDDFWQQRIYYAPFEIWTSKGSIEKYPKITQRIKQAGHSIGNHTAHHAWFQWPWIDTPEAVFDEFTEWEAISEQVLGPSNTRLFRPPYYFLSTNARETAKRLGYQVIMGESTGDASPGMTVDLLKEQTQSILAEWSNPYPCVLVFHDHSPTTYGHLDEIVSHLQNQGYRLVHFDPERL